MKAWSIGDILNWTFYFNVIIYNNFAVLQKLVQPVVITIPMSANKIYQSVVEIINGIKTIAKDPKSALAKIGKGTIQ